MIKRLALLMAALVTLSACGRATLAVNDTTSTSATATVNPAPTSTAPSARPSFCESPREPVSIGTVEPDDLLETSGAVASRTQTDLIWVHSDENAILFALSTTGSEMDRIAVPNFEPFDLEDIALGPGPDPNLDYLYLADIGDNEASRRDVTIRRIPEPVPGQPLASTDSEELRITYPDGPIDAETLLVDPATGEIVIAAKALSGETRLFGVPGDVTWGEPVRARDLGVVTLGRFAIATGGDVDKDTILIRTYDEVFGWTRPTDASLAAALEGPPCRVASVAEPQGEAIALLADGSFLTLSEGPNQPIYRFSGE